MANFVLLLRAVNVGGKNKVTMAILKEQLLSVGFTKVVTYINSGNILIFSEDYSKDQATTLINDLFIHHYDFPMLFVLIPFEEYRKLAEELPDWWGVTSHYRRNVLFFLDQQDTHAVLDQLRLTDNELLWTSEEAIFWAIKEDTNYSRNYYAKFAAHPLYKQVTIRNANTFDKLLQLIDIHS